MAVALRIVKQGGSGGVVLVSGPPGIGKSALLSQVRQRAIAAGVAVLACGFDPVEQVRPGSPVIGLLRFGPEPLVTAGEYEKIMSVADEPLVVTEHVASHLKRHAETHPTLVAVDDVQWADVTSRYLVRSLISRMVALPVAWVLASRGELVASDWADHDMVSVEQLRLRPLTASDLAALAQDRLGRVPDGRTRRFLAAINGNPSLAIHIIDGLARAAARGGDDSIPEEITAALNEWLAHLPLASRQLIELVAVAGRPLPISAAAALLPEGAGAELPAATEAGLVIATDYALTFQHELIREAVYAGIGSDRARTLHRALADYYVEAGDDPVLASLHARAAVTPGDLESATVLITTAELLAETDTEAAAELANLAFRTVASSRPEWLGLSLRCLGVLRLTQHVKDAMAVVDAITANADDMDVVGQTTAEAAEVLWFSGRVGELLARSEHLLETAALAPVVVTRLRAARALGRTGVLAGEEALSQAKEILGEARAAGDRNALTLALKAAGQAARNEGRHRVALGYFRELRTNSGISYLADEVIALQFLDRYDHAQTLLDQARAGYGKPGQPSVPALVYAQLWQDLNLGRLDQAADGCRTLLEVSSELGNDLYALQAIIAGASTALLRGELESAAAQLRAADLLGGADDWIGQPGLTIVRGWLEASRGALDAAMTILRPVLGSVSSYWPLSPCWTGLFLEIGGTAQERDFLAATARVAVLAAERNPGVASIEGIALYARGRSENDLDKVARAASVLSRSPRPVLRGFGSLCYGRALLGAGDKPAALVQLDAAWDEFHRMDARVYCATAERIMSEAGVRRAEWSVAESAPATGWESLTQAEQRVALLIASGLTNKAAASELGLSINTVGTHLRSVFAKLGVQTRVQLANAVRAQQAEVWRRSP